MARWHLDLEVDAPDIRAANIKALMLVSANSGVRMRGPVQSVPSREIAEEEWKVIRRNERLHITDSDDEC